MTTTPERISDLIDAHSDAHQDLLNYSTDLDNRVAATTQQFENWMDSAQQDFVDFSTEVNNRVTATEQQLANNMATVRSEYGPICTTPNQIMQPNSHNNGVDGLRHLYMSLSIEVAAAFRNGAGPGNGWPNDIGREFGESVGIAYTNAAFNLLRITWSGANQHSHPSRFHHSWVDGKHQGSLTTAAYIKLIEGSIGESFALKKSYPNDWGLYGCCSPDQPGYSPFYAFHNDLVLTSETGEMLIAMYGRATGRVDLENGRWGIFPALTS